MCSALALTGLPGFCGWTGGLCELSALWGCTAGLGPLSRAFRLAAASARASWAGAATGPWWELEGERVGLLLPLQGSVLVWMAVWEACTPRTSPPSTCRGVAVRPWRCCERGLQQVHVFGLHANDVDHQN